MDEQAFIPAPHLQDAERKLALLRALVAEVLCSLDSGDADQDGDASTMWALGYHSAAQKVRAKLAYEPPPSSRDEELEVTALRMGREPGGPCTGWLAALWDRAYAEGERNATVRLIVNLTR